MTDPVDPVFETERLLALNWSIDYAEQAFDLYGDSEVTRYIGGVTEVDLDGMRQRIERVIERNATIEPGYGSFPVFHKSTGEYVGTAMLKPLPDNDGTLTEDIEIGWHLARRHWGCGYATEFGHALIKMGFEDHQLRILHAVVDLENERSKNVALRLGMTHIGTTSNYYNVGEIEHFTLNASSQ